MLDITSLTSQYNLTPEQASDVENAFNALPIDLRENFTLQDFELLLAVRGINYTTPPGLGNEPSLDPPISKFSFNIKDLSVSASPGAAVLALLTKETAEQRRQNREQIQAKSDSIVEEIKSQAKDIRSKATTQLVMGIISGSVSIVGGAFSTLKSLKNISLDVSTEAGQNIAQNMMAKTKAQGEIFSGAASMISAGSQFAGSVYDGKMKEKDAAIEEVRTSMEHVKSVNDSLAELIHKTLSTADAMQQNVNQTRTKILG